MLFKPDRREPLSSINLTSPGSLFSVDTEKSTLKVFFNQLNFRYMETFRAFGFHFVTEQKRSRKLSASTKKNLFLDYLLQLLMNAALQSSRLLLKRIPKKLSQLLKTI